MQFEPLTPEDLEEVKWLQPEGWSDIILHLKYYIESDFCYPIKVTIDNKIAGTGASIMYPGSSWLAHIIVAAEYRNKGIGFQLVDKLIHHPRQDPSGCILLTATTFGEPVYRKHGFRPVTDYVFLARQEPMEPFPLSKYIIPFEEQYRPVIYAMDKRISGEERQQLLAPWLFTSFLFVVNRHLLGFYLPDLGEGMILADSTEAGIELMKMKYDHIDKAVLPVDNITGIRFLKEIGFAETATKGLKMILGGDLHWQPEKVFSRIGGNFG